MPLLTPADMGLAVTDLEARLASTATVSRTDPFETEPLPLERWLAEKRYVDLGFTPSPPQLTALRHIERVYYPETWDALGWTREDVDLVNFIVLKWGKGSGKDTISQVGLLRIVYLLQCLRNPQAYYNIGLHSTIHLTNIAVSAPQANGVFYTPFTELVKSSRYFKDLSDILVTKTEFAKKVELISGHSDTASQEGMNLLAGVADEIAEFKTKEELEKNRSTTGREPKNSAEGIDNMIRSSGRSRFPGVHKAIYLSWTRFEGDYICKVYDEGVAERERSEKLGERKLWWVSHLATWDVNPNSKKEDYVDEYRRNPENAMAKYECKPPKAKDAYFRNKLALGLAFPVQPAPMWHELVMGPDPDVPGQEGYQARFHFADEFRPVQGQAYAVHIDLAHTGDRAGFAMSYVSGRAKRAAANDDDVVTGLEEVTCPLAHYFEKGPHGEIELRWCRQLIFRLRERGFRIVYVTLDGYQSVDTIQILNGALGTRNPKAPAEQKKAAERYSLDTTTEGYDTLKSLIYAQLFHSYRTAPIGEGAAQKQCVWWKELQALERVGGLAQRAKIDHPPYGSKDVSDAIAGSARGALHAYRVWGASTGDDLWTGGAGDYGDQALTSEREMGYGGVPDGY